MDPRFYVTIVRNGGTPHQKTGRLLGPYDTREEAEERVADARRLAVAADPFAHFDAFGVTSWTLPEGQSGWPAGLLNAVLEAEQAVAR